MLGRISLITLALAAVSAAPASAGTVMLTDDFGWVTVAYTAGPGEKNAVHVAYDGSTLTFSDPGKAMLVDPRSAAGACTATTGRATCTIAGDLGQVRTDLGESADSFTAAMASDEPAAVIVDGGTGRDAIHGDSDPRMNFDSQLLGGGGDDVIVGGPDGEYVDGGLGADDMHGGGGNDTVQYMPLVPLVPHPIGVVVTLDDVANDGHAPTGGASVEGDNAHSDIENIRGTNGPDRLYGNDAFNFIRGDGGNDLIVPGGDMDSVSAGDGDDEIRLRDGFEDGVNCDEGDDAVEADGLDYFMECESVDVA